MCRNISGGQFSIYDFILPFCGHLNEDNRRGRLRNMIDLQVIDEEFSRHFRNKTVGQEAYPSSAAFGPLFIQRRLGLSDRELIGLISENPTCSTSSAIKNFEMKNLLIFMRVLSPVWVRVPPRCFLRKRKTLRMNVFRFFWQYRSK